MMHQDCPWILDLMLEQARLSASESELLHQHLAGCHDCRKEHAMMQQMQYLFADTDWDSAPAGFADRVIAAVHTEHDDAARAPEATALIALTTLALGLAVYLLQAGLLQWAAQAAGWLTYARDHLTAAGGTLWTALRQLPGQCAALAPATPTTIPWTVWAAAAIVILSCAVGLKEAATHDL